MSLLPVPGALNQAMSQLDRLALTPAPARVPVDGRSLPTLLAFAAEYGSLVNFYDLSNVPDGDWSAFFSNDQSVVLALLAALDLADIELQIDRLLDALRHFIGVEQRLRDWQDLSGSMTRLIGIAQRAGAAHASLLPALADVAARRTPSHLLEPATRLARHFGGESAEARLRREQSDSGWLQELLALLEEFLAGLLLALQQARDSAVAELKASLHDGRHAPQSGLWDAFAQLFGHAQHSLNRFPRRLLDFYQGQVLRQETRAEAGDQLILTLTPADGISQTSVAKGTQFLAGSDQDGLPIVYALDAALTASAATVTALRTVTLAQVAATSPAPQGTLVWSGVAALSATPPAIGAPFPVFGAGQAGSDGALFSQQASLGFAIASDCLLLAGGVRDVTIELSLATGKADAISLPPDAMAELLGVAFQLRYSTPAGWADIHGYQVAPPSQPDGPYALSFQLDADAAAWAPAPAQAGLPWDGLPTLQAKLLQQPAPEAVKPIYPYAELSTLNIETLALRVNVSGLEQLQISGPGGPLDASAPFALFGSPPVQHAALSISAPELFAKQLSCFSMSITWFGLPVASTGFKGYYEGYVIDADGATCAPGHLFDNRIFTAGLEVVNPGSWTLRHAPPFQRLFQLGPEQIVPAPLLPRTALREPVIARTAEPYYDPQLSAVRLRLEDPSYAFGNVLYAPNVMAASLQLTAIAAACAGQCTPPPSPVGAGDPIEPVLRACLDGDDAGFVARVDVAVQQALANLDGQALAAIEAAIGVASAAQEQPAWRASLRAQMFNTPARASLMQRLRRLRGTPPDGLTVHANLRQWLASHAAALQAGGAAASVAQAHAMLAAGDTLLAAQAANLVEPAQVPVARPQLAAGLLRLQGSLRTAPADPQQDCIQKCMNDAVKPAFPNQPWLPMAQGIQVSYSAAARQPPLAGQLGATALRFYHLCPFDQVEAVNWQHGQPVPLLAPLAGAGALEITLSAPARSLSLLFQLAPPPGGWPTDTEPPCWQQANGAGWQTLTPHNDSTNGLRQPGIVRLDLEPWPSAAPLRLRVAFQQGDAARYPLLAGLLGNAASATWQGPGGANGLGTPLPAGSVSKAVADLPEIGDIDQPEPSFGGRARASGAAFDLWLAERLRHKDHAIQAWDYASLVLAAYPSLWQVGVVAASNGAAGSAPGHVWLVVVPGAATPAIDDPTVPGCTAQALAQIAASLAPRISPFVALNVTNPPYLRLCVHADLWFADHADTQACISRLNTELIAYLSPWPTPALGVRAANYYTRQEVARFIRQRPYVKAIRTLQLVPDPQGERAVPVYYTSALSHVLHGDSSHALELLRQPNYTLPAPPREAA